MSLSKITLRDRTIESSYVEGNIGNHIFRIRTSKVRRDVIEFRFTRRDFKCHSSDRKEKHQYTIVHIFYLSAEEDDDKDLIEFLEKASPDSIEDIMLAIEVIKEAVDTDYFIGFLRDIFCGSYLDANGDQHIDYETIIPYEDKLQSIKKWMLIYFVLGLGYSFPVLEVLSWYLENYKIEVKRI